MFKRTRIGLMVALFAVPAFAHHAFSMFDSDKIVTIVATVDSFRWAMPHVWIDVTAALPAGDVQKWGLECHSPNIVARKGWSSSMLKPGDKITVEMHPMRDGTSSGSVIKVTLPDGRVLWNAEDASKT